MSAVAAEAIQPVAHSPAFYAPQNAACRHEGEGSAFALLKVRVACCCPALLCMHAAQLHPVNARCRCCVAGTAQAICCGAPQRIDTVRSASLTCCCPTLLHTLPQARGWATGLVAGEAGTSYRQALQLAALPVVCCPRIAACLGPPAFCILVSKSKVPHVFSIP